MLIQLVLSFEIDQWLSTNKLLGATTTCRSNLRYFARYFPTLCCSPSLSALLLRPCFSLLPAHCALCLTAASALSPSLCSLASLSSVAPFLSAALQLPFYSLVSVALCCGLSCSTVHMQRRLEAIMCTYSGMQLAILSDNVSGNSSHFASDLV